MYPRRAFDEDRILRLGAGLVGVALLAAASLAVSLALQHMETLEAICGAGRAPHCGWCYGAASLIVLGLAAFAFAA
ncbi:MAG: hypothetical protein Q8M90_07715, partial [Brevundimonas sp.]|nr:hypothetical protein [Brevundimonas sp.]